VSIWLIMQLKSTTRMGGCHAADKAEGHRRRQPRSGHQGRHHNQQEGRGAERRGRRWKGAENSRERGKQHGQGYRRGLQWTWGRGKKGGNVDGIAGCCCRLLNGSVWGDLLKEGNVGAVFAKKVGQTSKIRHKAEVEGEDREERARSLPIVSTHHCRHPD
jgi:hypothetical protein